MASYTVKINIDPSWVDNFNASGMSLCMAKVTKDASGKEVYNVIAKTITELAPDLVVTWKDEYMIQATTIVFNKGAKIEGFAKGKAINFGETYNAASWTKVQTFKDKDNVSDDSIGFSNEMACSILLTMKQGNSFVPSHFWFQQRIEANTMILNYRGNSITVSADPGQPSAIKYNASGEWETVSDK